MCGNDRANGYAIPHVRLAARQMSPATLADWLAYIDHQHPRSIAMGLDRVREVAERMGLARPARHVITVAGTNG